MNAADVRELSDAELAAKHADLKEDLFNLRFQNVTGQLDNPRRLAAVKHDIARVLTVQRQRELAGATTPAAETAGDTAKKKQKKTTKAEAK